MTKTAYSNYFKSFIKCVRYYSDENWFFCPCNKRGELRGVPILAKSNYKCFDWKEIDK